jgi:hypothetical protein
MGGNLWAKRGKGPGAPVHRTEVLRMIGSGRSREGRRTLMVTGVDRVGSRQRLGGLLRQAAENGSAVMAFNVVDPASIQGVLDAAEAAEVPVVVQLSVRSARQWGVAAALACHTEASGGRAWPSVLHLDHCTDREFAERCLWAGWDSVLFDASGLPYAAAVRQTAELVELAAECGGDVEGSSRRSPGSERYGPAGRARTSRPVWSG